MRSGIAFVWLAACALPASGQLLRGTVTEAGSGRAVVGALVTIHTSTATVGEIPFRRAITNQRGDYALQLPPGLYRATFRRVGVSPAVRDVAIDSGQTVVVDVQLERFTTLPAIAVRDAEICTIRGFDALRVAQLWEAAHISLSVVAASQQDTTVHRRLIRFKRVRRLTDSEIVEESFKTFNEYDGNSEPMFRSLSGDSLSRLGYWEITGPESMTFYAPDAEALLSKAFLRDHCFQLARTRSSLPGMVGLSFQPAKGRPPNEIVGTLWLDERSYELQRIEFEWLGLRAQLRNRHVRGELQFVRLPSGHTIVKHWSLVMPRPRVRTVRIGATSTIDEFGMDDLGEDGGFIQIGGLDGAGAPGSVKGRVTDSRGAALRNTRVRVEGLARTTTVDDQGHFRFDSLPPGVYSLVAEHPDFDAYHLRVGTKSLVLEEGATRTLQFRAATEKVTMTQLCPRRIKTRATLHVTLVDRVSQQRLVGVPVRLNWFRVVAVRRGDVLGYETRDVNVDWKTNDDGSVMFCSIATGVQLVFGFLSEDGRFSPLQTFQLGPWQDEIALLRVSMPDGERKRQPR